MIKTMIILGATAMSIPALGQDGGKATGAPVTFTPTQTAPAQTTPQTQTTPAVTPAMDSTAPSGATAQTAPAEATPVTEKSQIAQVVDTEFPTYDKNSDNILSRSEFRAWMVALKTTSDPATVKWVDGAFASADADKSKTVSKAELTKYLSQGAG